MKAPTIAEQLADFAHGLRLGDVPPAIVGKAKLHMLDMLGCAIAGAGTPYAKASIAALRQLDGGGGSVAIGQAERLGLRDAAMFNAGIGHMLDFDDTHAPTLNHVSVACLPPLLALGARTGASGSDLLAAWLVAVEAACRVGLGAGGAAFLHHGVHPTGAVNVFGVALGAARLLGLGREAMVHAQGLALGYAAGSMEWQRDGADAKRLHPGNAAVGGLTAASFAAAGITGPRLPYEGRAGLYRLYLGEDAATESDVVTAGLGARWAFLDVAIKPFPLVHHVHGVIECALQLVQEDAVRPDAIDRATALIAAPQIAILCEPAEAKRNPSNAYQGIFSLYHTIATTLVKGRMTLAETGADLLHDPVIAALRQRIDYVVDCDSHYPRAYSGGLRVRLRNGRVLERHVARHLGSVERPLTSAQVVGKFRDNAGRLYPPDRIGAVEGAVMSLDGQATPAGLAALLGAP